MKKLIAIILTLVLCICFSSAVLAANTGLIDPSRKGSITIHKFDNTGEADDVGALGNGTEITDTDGYGKPLAGITFKITLLPDATADTTVNDAKDFIEEMDENDLADYQKTGVTNASGVYAFTNLEQGIYLVEEESNAGIAVGVEPFLVSIPMTNPADQSSWLYDVHVYPKNTVKDLSIEKSIIDEDGNSVSSITANIGDLVTWEIAASIPADIASIVLADADDGNGLYGYFFIDDTLDSRLDYVSTTVTLVDADGDVVHTFTSGVDFTLTAPDPSDENYVSGGYILVDFDKTAGIDVLKEALKDNNTISITIVTRINGTAVTDLSDSIENSAGLYYTNDDGDPSEPVEPTTPTDPPEVEVGGVAIYKVNQDDEALNGAVFTLYASRTDAESGTAVQRTGSNWTETSGTNPGNIDGYIYISGKALEEAGLEIDDDTEYFFVETTAPTGYELLNSIHVLAFGTTTKVVNTASREGGFKMPLTGGQGILWFIVIGMALILTAALLFFISRKKEN